MRQRFSLTDRQGLKTGKIHLPLVEKSRRKESPGHSWRRTRYRFSIPCLRWLAGTSGLLPRSRNRKRNIRTRFRKGSLNQHTNVNSHSEKHPTAAPTCRRLSGVISGAQSHGTEFQLMPKQISQMMSMPSANREEAVVSNATPTVKRTMDKQSIVDPSISTFLRPSRSTRKIGGKVPTQKAI